MRSTALCFLMALCAWGTYFYGNSFYLYALSETHPWSVAQISTAISVGFWTAIPASLVLGWVYDHHGRRFGAASVVCYGAIALAAGITALGRAESLWQVYAAYALMGSAYPALSTPAISATLLQRVPAARYQWSLSMALTGASVGGAIAAPLLVALTAHAGLEAALAMVGTGVLVALLPAALWVLWPRRGTTPASAPAPHARARPALREALARGPFWLIFLIALTSLAAQVGFLAHQLSLLTTGIVPGAAAGVITLTALGGIAGRFICAWLLSRTGIRTTALTTYITMASGIAVFALPPGALTMTAGSAIMGLSVGAVVMLPPLMCRAAYPPQYYGRVYGLISVAVYAGGGLGPALTGAMRELSGFTGALLGLIALSVTAALLSARLHRREQTR